MRVRRTRVENRRDSGQRDGPEVQQVNSHVDPFSLGVDQGILLEVVVVVVAVQDPPVPVVGTVLGAMGAVERVSIVAEDTRVDDRERRLTV
jgi:hypothetical protein